MPDTDQHWITLHRVEFGRQVSVDDAPLEPPKGVACQPGVHRTQLDASKGTDMMDRSSFTRLRIVQHYGDWNGDPMQTPESERPHHAA